MMKHLETKKYVHPSTAVLFLEAEPLMTVSGDSAGFEEKSGENDVVYDSRRRGWNCENWIETQEEQ